MTRLREHPVVLVASGVVFALVGLGVLVASAVAWLDRAAYERAAACAGTSTEDCVRDVTARVLDTRVDRYRNDEYEVHLRVLDGIQNDDPWVELPVPDDVFPALYAGREVDVRIWRGQVARITVPGVATAETAHSPLTVSVELAVGGAAFTVIGAGLVVAGRDRGGLLRRTPAAHLFTATFAAALTLPVVVIALDVYDARAVAATFLAVWLVTWVAVRRR